MNTFDSSLVGPGDGNAWIYGFNISLQASAVGDSEVNQSDPISAPKLQRSLHDSDQQSGNASDQTRIFHFVQGSTGTLRKFSAFCDGAPAGSTTVTVDLQVNGVSVLGSVITISSSTTPNSELVATISSSGLTDGDRVAVVITTNQVGTSALPTGVGWLCEWDEDRPV